MSYLNFRIFYVFYSLVVSTSNKAVLLSRKHMTVKFIGEDICLSYSYNISVLHVCPGTMKGLRQPQAFILVMRSVV